MPEFDSDWRRLEQKTCYKTWQSIFSAHHDNTTAFLISTHEVNEREIFIYAWEKGKREFEKDGGIKKGNKVHPTLIRIAFKQCYQGVLLQSCSFPRYCPDDKDAKPFVLKAKI